MLNETCAGDFAADNFLLFVLGVRGGVGFADAFLLGVLCCCCWLASTSLLTFSLVQLDSVDGPWFFCWLRVELLRASSKQNFLILSWLRLNSPTVLQATMSISRGLVSVAIAMSLFLMTVFFFTGVSTVIV